MSLLQKKLTSTQLDLIITEYLSDNETLATVCGLAYALGLNSRQELLELCEGSFKHRDRIMRALLYIEIQNEKALYHKDSYNAAKFNLMNNFNWFDFKSVEVSEMHNADNDNLNISLEDKLKLIETIKNEGVSNEQ